MKRKLMAFALIFAMLASISPAVAADEKSATPTVEEILNEYHLKAFEAQMQGETDTASTWSHRGGSAKTLEQETVDTLTAAGYEAYHVTADNYETLEVELKTDFAGMGLDPQGSYIVVIHGEDPGITPSAKSRTSPHPELDQEDTLGGLPSTYTYNGVTYSVRFITVSYAPKDSSKEHLRCSSIYTLRELGIVPEPLAEFLDFCITATVDWADSSAASVASILSLVDNMDTDSNLITLDAGDIIVYACTLWNRQYIEVMNDQTGVWSPSQCSEYTNNTMYFFTSEYNSSTGFEDVIEGNKAHTTIYSPFYDDLGTRLTDAINVYLHSNIVSHDEVDVRFYFDGGGLAIDGNSRYLFTHYSPIL